MPSPSPFLCRVPKNPMVSAQTTICLVSCFFGFNQHTSGSMKALFADSVLIFSDDISIYPLLANVKPQIFWSNPIETSSCDEITSLVAY